MCLDHLKRFFKAYQPCSIKRADKCSYVISKGPGEPERIRSLGCSLAVSLAGTTCSAQSFALTWQFSKHPIARTSANAKSD